MQSLPSISILVMSYNQEAYIGACVDSVLSQEYDGELEIIFCDDNSSDSTFSTIQEKVYKYTGTRNIKLYQSSENVRVAANMNNGIKLAQGEWIMRMDGDDIMHEDRVRLTSEIICNNPDIVAVCGRYQHFKTTPQAVKNPDYKDLKIQINDYQDITPNEVPQNLEWWGGIMCMKRSIFDIFGPLPSECDVLDDTMFATRALMLGKYASVTNATFIYYRRHENNVSSENSVANSIFDIMKQDKAMRQYYRRGIHCHKPILDEISTYVSIHPEYNVLYEYFSNRFNELKRQGEFWQKSWCKRIKDAHISGHFWRKIPWAIRVLCPFTYALASKFRKKS